MRLHLREDSRNPKHTRLTLFINGANCGSLCLDTADADDFKKVVETGAAQHHSYQQSKS